MYVTFSRFPPSKVVGMIAIKMPSLDMEDEYRKQGVRVVGTLAQLTAAVEDDLKTLRGVRQALSNLKGIKFAPRGD